MNSAIKSFLLFICLMLSSSVFTVESGYDNEISMKTEIQQLIDDHRVRTAIVMSIENDSSELGIVKLGEISDSRRELPDENSTVFEIGSITKVFTALLVQTLVDDDLLHWDDTISECLPDIEFVNEAVASVTLRELATHRSGLPRLPNNFTDTEVPGNAMDPYANYGEQDLVAFFESFDPPELKKEHAYSNLGFAILGYIVAKTLDTSYAEAMNQRVFQPLEMNNSTALDSVKDVADLAAGYSNTANMGTWNFNVHAGAGVIRSTARDMYKFIRANFIESEDVIHHSIRSIRELQYESNQALGWISEASDQETTIFWHNGQTGGYASFLAIDPEAKSGWVILTTSTESAAITRIGASFYREVVLPNSADFSPYVGVYKLAEDQYMTISSKDGNLQIQVTGQRPIVLAHTEDHVFELQALSLKADFELGEDGTATTLKWSQPGVSIDAERVDDSFGIGTREEASIDPEVLTEYVGQYQVPVPEFAPVKQLIATVKRVQDRLFVQVTGEPEFRVFPMSPTRFFYKVIDAEIEFQKDDNGAVSGVVFHQGGEHFAPRINDKE